MQDFLEHFGIRDESLPATDELLEAPMRIRVVRMCGPNEAK